MKEQPNHNKETKATTPNIIYTINANHKMPHENIAMLELRMTKGMTEKRWRQWYTNDPKLELKLPDCEDEAATHVFPFFNTANS